MKLTIIVPHYNSTKSLIKLIDSIPVEGDIETIIVDDNSDQSLADLEKFIQNQTREIKFFKNDSQNKGAGACRNIGLQNASGEWILFADDDDYFVNGFYKTLLKYFDTHNDVVFFTPTSKEYNTNKITERHLPYKTIIDKYIEKHDLDSELELRYKFHVPWSKLYNSAFISKHHIFFDEILASNDIVFSAKTGYLMKKYEVSKEVIYCVTKKFGSLTVNTSQVVFDSRLQAYINYHNFLKANLDKSHLSYLDIGGAGYIVNSIKYKYGIKKTLDVYGTLKNNDIKIFNKKYINPMYVFKRIIFHYKGFKRDKKYFSKKI